MIQMAENGDLDPSRLDQRILSGSFDPNRSEIPLFFSALQVSVLV